MSKLTLDFDVAERVAPTVNYGARFTGFAEFKPFVFNPTNAQIAKLRDSAESSSKEEPVYTEHLYARNSDYTLVRDAEGKPVIEKANKYTRVVLYGKVFKDRNYVHIKPLPGELPFPDALVLRYQFNICSDLVFSETKKKEGIDSFQVLDRYLQTAWVTMDGKKLTEYYKQYRIAVMKLRTSMLKDGDVNSAENKELRKAVQLTETSLQKYVTECLRAEKAKAMANPKYNSVKFMDEESVFVARYGEYALLSLLVTMSNLREVSISSDEQLMKMSEVAKAMYKRSLSQDIRQLRPIFDMFLAGDFEDINENIFGEGNKKVFGDGTKEPGGIPFGVFLGVTSNKSGEFYQEIFSPKRASDGDGYIRKVYDKLQAKAITDYAIYGVSKISPAMAKKVADEKYPYKGWMRDSFAIQRFIPVAQEPAAVDMGTATASTNFNTGSDFDVDFFGEPTTAPAETKSNNSSFEDIDDFPF